MPSSPKTPPDATGDHDHRPIPDRYQTAMATFICGVDAVVKSIERAHEALRGGVGLGTSLIYIWIPLPEFLF